MIETVEELAVALAKKRHDGHLTIFRFGSGWKATFGTPNIWPEGAERDALFEQPPFPSMQEALAYAINKEVDEILEELDDARDDI